MKRLLKIILASNIFFVASFTASTVQAHHSFSATFQIDNKIQVTGVVSEFRFVNPHMGISFNVTSADGSVTVWESEGKSATVYRRSGWNKDTIKKGELIRVSGDSTKDGSPMVSIDKIEILNPDDNSVVQVLDRYNSGSPIAAESEVLSLATTLANGQPNLTGYWINAGRGPTIPQFDLNAAGKELQSRFDPANDPQIFCDLPGLVRQAGATPHGAKITQLADRVIFEFEEYGSRREVFFTEQANTAQSRSLLGTSIARYEDDTLIIETNNLLSALGSPEGKILSDTATTVEMYRRVDGEAGPMINMQMIVTDPVYLEKPAILSYTKPYADEYDFITIDCRPPMRERGPATKPE